jgi:choline kinase
MRAIILSAGQGRRLLPLTENTPKCCLPLANHSILEWQLSQISKAGIDEVVVVTGFEAERVEAVVDAASEKFGDLKIRTLHNPFYARSDNLGTCWVARGEMLEPFLIINGDTLFEAEILEKLLNSTHDYPITLTTDSKGDYDDDDMKVVTDEGRLLRVGKTLDREYVNGESIGMMVFDQQGADTFRLKVETLMKSPEGLTRWYLSAIDELADEGHVGVCSIQGLSWCEVDDHADLKHAEHVVVTWPEHHGSASLIS